MNPIVGKFVELAVAIPPQQAQQPEKAAAPFQELLGRAVREKQTRPNAGKSKPAEKGEAVPDEPKSTQADDAHAPPQANGTGAQLALAAVLVPPVQAANAQGEEALRIPMLPGRSTGVPVQAVLEPGTSEQGPVLPVRDTVPQGAKVQIPTTTAVHDAAVPPQTEQTFVFPTVGTQASVLQQPPQKEFGQSAVQPVTVSAGIVAQVQAAASQPAHTADIPLRIVPVSTGVQHAEHSNVAAVQTPVAEAATRKQEPVQDGLPSVQTAELAGAPGAIAQTRTAEPFGPTVQPAGTYQTPDQIEQVRTQITQHLREDRMEFRMQLRPQELGQVEVHMVLEGGKLAVEIFAATPRAVQALTRNAEALAASLQTGNVELASVQVVQAPQTPSGDMGSAFAMFDQQAGQQLPQEPQQQTNTFRAASHAEPEAQPVPEEHQATGRMDYSI